MILQAAAEHGIDLTKSYLVGTAGATSSGPRRQLHDYLYRLTLASRTDLTGRTKS